MERVIFVFIIAVCRMDCVYGIGWVTIEKGLVVNDADFVSASSIEVLCRSTPALARRICLAAHPEIAPSFVLV